MASEQFEQVPEPLRDVVSVLFECQDPEGVCDYTKVYDVDGPVPRLNERNYLTFERQIPSYCPGCGSAMFKVNGVEIQNANP